MIRIHHAAGSRSSRVVWLCEELGLDYELRTLAFGGEEMRSAEFRALSPLGRLPVVELDGVPMIESIAIMQWILERHGEGRLEPAIGSPERIAYLQWLHFGEASAMVPIGEFMRAAVFTPEERRDAGFIAGARERIGEVFAVLDAALATSDHLVGDAFTAADISVGYAGFLAGMVGQLPEPEAAPRLHAYRDRLAARPAFQRAFSG